ncbi:type II secretion system protein GspL [Emcibacter sp.]|uniref:type II secretion system protein GspL n=1 Tax=Emcibacter sp. TaxID=1979954 RepID=UPI003A8FD57C
MSIGVILYITPTGEITWRRAGEAGRTPALLADGAACRAAIDEDRGLPVRLVLPGNKVTARILEMPDTSEENARAAVTFLMEDHLAVPVAGTHLVSKKLEDGKRLALAVAHVDMEAWLEQLKEMDIRPDEVAVDVQLLAPMGEVVSLEAGDWRYCRKAEGDGFVLDRQTVAMLEQNGLAETEGLSIPSLTDMAGLFDRFARTDIILNLLQGPYGSQASLMEYFKPLARIGVLALVVFGLYLGHLWLEAHAWRQAADVLDQQAEVLFKGAFPDVSRIVNIRAQLKSRFSLNEGSGEDGFMQASSRLFEVLEGSPEIQLDKMRFGSTDSRLYVTLSAGSFDGLEMFKRQLSAGGSLKVSDQGARQDGNRVSGDFALEVTP